MRYFPVSLQAGFTMISGIFILVVLAALGAFMVGITMTQQQTSVQDVQGAQAYQAARAGIEWGVYQTIDPANATAVAPTDPAWPNLPICPASPTSMSIEGYSVSVTCTRSPIYNESGSLRSIAIYTLRATASRGAVATAAYVERELQATISKCRTTDGIAPGYACP